MSYTTFLEGALSESANIARSFFGKVTGTAKPGDQNQVLTEADIAVGTYLMSRIRESYPLHNIIDEEAGVVNQESHYTWVIDPIDGTSNFAAGVPTYGIMLGLLENNIPIAGGVILPAFHELYLAEKGTGARLNGTKVMVTAERDLTKLLLAYGIDGHRDTPEKTRAEARTIGELALAVRNIRTNGSVFDVAQVASGKFGASLSQTSKIWDNVAQHILIEEAGGLYTDFFGKPIDYTNHLKRSQETFSWCAASPALHTEIQKIISASQAR